jgi:small nuclear ribonucleoprotein (snRNP)-like protein
MVGVSLRVPLSSTTKTGCHDIAEILLKVALSTKNQNQIKGTLYNYLLHMG